jgi:hypothetical protein
LKISKRLAIILLIALAALIPIGTYAYVFIYVPSTIQYTAVTPDVQFFRWSDSAKRNNITLLYNFAANVTTYDENATWGITNSGGSPKTVENWIVSITDTSKVANITIEILDASSVVKATIQWVTGDPAPPTTAQSWSASAGAFYTLRIWCTGATSISSITIMLGLQTTEG